MQYSPPGSSIHGIFQAKLLYWVAISFFRVLPDPGIKPGSPSSQADALLSQPPVKPIVMAENSDKMWSTGEENGKPLQYSCLENPMNSMNRQNDRILKEELPWAVSGQYATGDQWRNNSRKNKRMESKKNNTQLWM